MCSKDVRVKGRKRNLHVRLNNNIIIAWRLQIYANESASVDNNIILHPILCVCAQCMPQELRSIYGFSLREKLKGWKSLDLANIFTVIKSYSEAHGR